MTEEEKSRYSEYLMMMSELKEMEGNGALLYLEDEPAYAEQIARHCVFMEDNPYSREIIINIDKKNAEIHFHKNIKS